MLKPFGIVCSCIYTYSIFETVIQKLRIDMSLGIKILDLISLFKKPFF
ncbi:protein of unknown function [Candidatus Nitrosocosmicus franklandus]|uniref:Uncharacterized protein n=1 Tax=Candidatus Nitrosocosmicus franklandianus TaxID=1798806 RepID=A0A484IEL6_9ARCH|nr:protein of unknown function [Candidatus Nitrosocosmicus franklandus]